MKVRKVFLAMSVAAAAIPAAYADNFVGGEVGWDTTHASRPQNTTATVEQMRREYQAFRAHPVFFDSTVMIQGELGYVSANQGSTADRQPSIPHTHALGNVGAPTAQAAPIGEAERRDYHEQYKNAP